MYGAALNDDEWASVTMPGSHALADVRPNTELRELEGVSRNVKMGVLAPVLTEFFAVVDEPAIRKDFA